VGACFFIMARPTTNTINYFPHPVKDGDRMYIMETEYGMTGYACYYKLLGLLGRSENHWVCFEDLKTVISFSASLKVTKEQSIQMLTTLADIGTIDKDLWVKKKVVWCQELIDSVSDLYDKRKRECPVKPVFDNINGSSDMLIVTETPQKKRKEKKVNENKVNESKIKQEDLVFPFSSEDFLKVWNILILEPKWKRKTLNALQASLDTLSKAQNEQDAIQMMKNSIAGNWQGVFLLNNNSNQNGTKQGQTNYHSNKADVAQLAEQTRNFLRSNQVQDNGGGD